MSQNRWFTFTRTALILGIFAALIIVLGGLPGSVAAAPSCTTDCYVDPSGNDANAGDQLNPLKSIQLAINSVNPGGTVHLAAGTYFENPLNVDWRELYIDKSLTMVGAGSGVTIIELPMKMNGIEIFGTNLNVTLEGMTLTKQLANASAANFNLRVGLTGSSFSNLTFRDIESAYANGRNAHLENGTYVQVIVEDSNFHHAGSYGFSVAMPVSAMMVTDSHFDNNGLQNVHITQRRGLDLYKVTNLAISGGTFNNNVGAGIAIADSSGLTIDNVEIKNNAAGISFWEWVSATSDVTIQNSNIEGNGDGILIGTDPGKTIDSFTITANDVSSNGRGVVIWGAGGPITNVVVNRNNLSGNPNGRLVYGGSVVGKLNATCNWWGSAAGPGAVDPMVTFNPWLMTSNLNGPCGIQVELDSPDTQVCTGGGVLNIDFSNVVGLYGYEFKVDYEDTLVSATGGFVNSWFNTGTGLVPPGWNAQCSGGTCKFAASLQSPTPAKDGGGPVAKITFNNLPAPVGGTFTPTIYGIVLTDRDGMPLAYDAEAGAPEFAACGVATVSGKVSLQGRATPGDPGVIKLVSADLGTVNATFDGNGNFNVPNIPVLPGGSAYKLQAMHILYIGNELDVTLEPDDVLEVDNTRLLGGDANNGGFFPPLVPPYPGTYDTGVNMTDITCIGAAFGGPGATCGTLPDTSTDINRVGGTNIQDLSIAAGNYDVHPFQDW